MATDQGNTARRLPSGNHETIALLVPSPIRRHLGSGMMLVLGALLFYLATRGQGTSMLPSFLFAGMGLSSLLIAWKMHTATSNSLILREDGLYSSDGTVVAQLANIARVERGLFAFKPSNGFLILLNNPMSRAWHPGLWWRFGRRIGIGGVTPQAEGKVMAERIHMMLQDRN